MRRARYCADFPQQQQRPGLASVADQLRVQPHRPFRRRRSCRRQGHFPRRRDPALSAAALCLPRRRVGWGSQLFGDLIEHWELRNAKALERMDPAKLDRKLLMDLVVKHGYDDMAEALRARDGYPNPEGQYLTGGRE